jgi:hypothetical protein
MMGSIFWYITPTFWKCKLPVSSASKIKAKHGSSWTRQQITGCTVISQKIELFMITTVRTSDPMGA